jgi:hypothetical protein
VGALERLTESEWRDRAARHRGRLAPFAEERVARSAQKKKHPVRDFLFEYYSYRPAQLLRWTPGPDVLLEGARPSDLPWNEFTSVADGLILGFDSFPGHRLRSIRWALQYLEGIAERAPLFGCFGLHEWAMVYRTPEVRHARTPLRLTPERIAAVVEAEQLCCTHFDAFRFFSPAAVARNRQQLSRVVMDRFDQRGCVHVTMDLYRYAYKIAPWVGGELIADAFELACQSRELDMRASPYDLTAYGVEPIPIETAEGKDVYVRGQRELAEKAVPIRERLIAAYRILCGTNERPVGQVSQPVLRDG